MREIEVKVKTDDLEGVRRRLTELGARLKEQLKDEHDLLFRCARDPESLQGQVLRLRLQGSAGLLTWKGQPQFNRGIKHREELQTQVADAQALRELLQMLGYEIRFEYSKSREYWDLRGMTVSLDELPFGRYVEVEGDEAALEDALSDLGLADAQRVEEGYPQLAARHLGIP